MYTVLAASWARREIKKGKQRKKEMEANRINLGNRVSDWFGDALESSRNRPICGRSSNLYQGRPYGRFPRICDARSDLRHIALYRKNTLGVHLPEYERGRWMVADVLNTL